MVTGSGGVGIADGDKEVEAPGRGDRARVAASTASGEVVVVFDIVVVFGDTKAV